MSMPFNVTTVLVLGALSFAGCANVPGEGPAPAEGATEAVTESTRRDEHVQRRLEHLQERLDLSPEQVELVEGALEEFLVIEDESRERFREEIAGILNENQLAEFEAMRERGPRGHHGRRGFGGPGHHGPPDPAAMLDRMTERLDLTDAQKAEIEPLFEGMHARHEQIRDLPRDERRQARMAAMDEMKTAMDAILTEEQLLRVEEHFGHGPRRWRGPPPTDR